MRRAALLLLGIGSPLLLLALLAGGEGGAMLFGLLSLLFPTALCIAGAARGRGGGAWRWVLPVTGLVLLLSGAGLLLLGERGQEEPQVLGLPPATVLMLVGLGLIPLQLTGFGYAADFRRPAGEGRRAAGESRSGESDRPCR